MFQNCLHTSSKNCRFVFILSWIGNEKFSKFLVWLYGNHIEIGAIAYICSVNCRIHMDVMAEPVRFGQPKFSVNNFVMLAHVLIGILFRIFQV